MSLLLQHRELLRWLEGLEFEVDCLRSAQDDENALRGARTRLGVRLFEFSAHLAQHFERESRSTELVFSDHPDAAIRERLRTLDAEHPALLQAFLGCHRRLLDPSPSDSAVVTELRAAIEAFRLHEAREDEIFTQD